MARGTRPKLQATSGKLQASSRKLDKTKLQNINKLESMKTIKIEVYGGCVTEVTGLPEGYDYEIIDHDHLEEEKNES